MQIEDLLGREPVQLDDKNLHDFLTGKTVMVTGAGGSIGSELVRQIAEFRPRLLLLIERTEFVLFQIERELTKNFSELNSFRFLPMSATSRGCASFSLNTRPKLFSTPPPTNTCL